MSRYLAFISYRHKERDQKVSSLLRLWDRAKDEESARLEVRISPDAPDQYPKRTYLLK